MLNNGNIGVIDDTVDVFADACQCWRSSVNSRVGVPECILCTYHKMLCTLAGLPWVIGVEILGDYCATIDGCIKTLIQVHIKGASS